MAKMTIELFIIAICTLVAPSRGQGQQLTYLVQEEKAPDTFVGNITKDAELWRSFTSRDWQRDAYFSIDSPTLPSILPLLRITGSGIMFTASPIDRELFCARRARCDVPLTVQVQSAELFLQISVLLTIIDIDDNAPVFDPQNITAYISESAQGDTRLPILLADDLDSPAFGANRYEVVLPLGANKFALRQTDSPDGSVEEVYLALLTSLDRETVDIYDVRIVAYDTSSSGSLDLTVIVNDVNDNSPVFERNIYDIEIAEDATVGSTIVQLQADDKDAGGNGDVVYKLSDKSARDYGKTFSINATTGVIVLRQPLDFEVTNEYSLVVIAQDGGLPPNSATTRLSIHITDINDNAPQVSIISLVGGCSDCGNNVYLPVISPVGMAVATLRVTDADSSLNGQFSCKVTEEGGGSYFGLDGNSSTTTTIVSLRRSIEHLSFAQLPFDVTCEDNGSPPRYARHTFFVNVIANSAPRFTRPEFSAVIAENNEPGASITQILAVDVDSGSYGRIQYEMETEDADTRSSFIVDPVTGVVRALVTLDREMRDRYRFKVMATDHGQPPLSTNAYVTILVSDVNDLAPKFTTPVFAFIVEENQPPGTCIGQLTASDGDGVPFNRYRFVIDAPQNAFFSVDNEGNLCTVRGLDRELTQSFRFVVKVTDMANAALASMADVTVTVADRNDNKPELVYPDSENNTLTIARSLQANRLMVGRVVARDADVGMNAELFYEIVSGNEQGYFAIEDSTGVIKTNKPITVDLDGKQFVLDIAVIDSGVPRLRTVATLRISVNISAHVAAAQAVDVSIKIIVVIAAVMSAVAIALIIVIVTVIRTKGKSRHSHPPPPTTPYALGDDEKVYKQLAVPASSLSDADTTGELLLPPGMMTGMGMGERERRVSQNTFSDVPSLHLVVDTDASGRLLQERGREQMQRLIMKPSRYAVASRVDADSMSDSGCSVDTASPTADVPRNGQDVTDYMLRVSPTKGPVSPTGNHLVRVLSSVNASKGLVRVATPTEEVMPASAILHHQYQLSHLPNCQQHPHQYYQLQQSYPPHFHTHQQYPSVTSHDNNRVRRPTSVSPVNQLPLPPHQVAPLSTVIHHCELPSSTRCDGVIMGRPPSVNIPMATFTPPPPLPLGLYHHSPVPI